MKFEVHKLGGRLGVSFLTMGIVEQLLRKYFRETENLEPPGDSHIH